jgi:hypothetical protein
MATATQKERATHEAAHQDGEVMASGTLVVPTEPPPGSAAFDRRGEYRCECGHVLHVYGGGRHRVYFDPSNERLDEPVMNRACPECGHGLPGKNPP